MSHLSTNSDRADAIFSYVNESLNMLHLLWFLVLTLKI